MIIEEQLYLQHYGKKGMKWGERNYNKRVQKLKRVEKGEGTLLERGSVRGTSSFKALRKGGVKEGAKEQRKALTKGGYEGAKKRGDKMVAILIGAGLLSIGLRQIARRI
jgi:hypothetical protein